MFGNAQWRLEALFAKRIFIYMYLIHCISRVLRDKFPAGDSGRVSQVVKEEPLAIPDHLVQGLLDG